MPIAAKTKKGAIIIFTGKGEIKVPSNLDNINDRAQEKFSQLRTKFKLNQVISTLPQSEQTRIKEEAVDCKKIEEVLGRTNAAVDYSSHTVRKEASERADFVDSTFNFIEALELSPNLSLAMGLIISYSKTKNKEDLEKAIKALRGEV